MIKPDAIEESGPERTCAATGWKGPPEAMLRFALSGDGVVTPDIRRRLPGRGVWIRLDAAAASSTQPARTRAAINIASACSRDRPNSLR